MTLSKRERVLKALELDGEPDLVPINYFHLEPTASTFQIYKNSEEKKKYNTQVVNKFNNVKIYLTEQRFFNVDIFGSDPFGLNKIKVRVRKGPPEYPDCHITTMDGRLYKSMKQVNTGLSYEWYMGGYYTTPEILYSYWDKYGRPTELINDRINYSPKIWDGYIEALAPYYYSEYLHL